MKKNRFTLIELLVVIAIIAILAGMLLPALNSARDKGYNAACINIGKQMGTCDIMYGADNNDFVTPNRAIGNVLWHGLQQPYAPGLYSKKDDPNKRAVVPMCPAAPREDGKILTFYATTYSPWTPISKWQSTANWLGRDCGGYGRNYYTGDSRYDQDHGGYTVFIKQSGVRAPSKKIGLMDAYYCDIMFNGNTKWEDRYQGQIAWSRHDKSAMRCNVVYLDGHCAPFNYMARTADFNNSHMKMNTIPTI